MDEGAYRRRDGRVVRRLLLGLLLLFGACYLAACWYAGDRVPRGTTVAGVHLGGLRPAAAERALGDGIRRRASKPIVVAADDDRRAISPASAGLTVDLPASVHATVVHRSLDPRRIWDYASGGTDHAAVVRVDETALRAAVSDFAEEVDQPAVQGAVTFRDGEPVAQYPQVGSLLDRPVAARAVRRAFLHPPAPDGVVRLRTIVDRSPITSAEVSRAMDDFANPAASGSVVVSLRGRDTRLQPAAFTPALSLRPEGSRLEPHLDAPTLLRLVRPRMRAATRPARDATVRLRDGRPRVVPARDGLTFRDGDVTRPFLRLLRRDGSERRLTVRGVRVPPKVTTSAARRLRITQRVSSFTTHFPYAPYRNINIPRAASLIDGTVLRPGQTFSLNRTVGERTKANGFTKGYVISDGVYAKEYGGGVSQVATTTFNAAFFAGMRDDEHKAHSFYINRYPVGREATVVWPDIDLKFTDTTPYGVLVHATVDKATPHHPGAVHVSMWSTKYWDITTSDSRRYDLRAPGTRHLHGATCVPNVGADGFDIDVYRLFHRHGSSKVDHRERIHTRYLPSDTVTCS